MCGEKGAVIDSRIAFPGSPPRVRGKALLPLPSSVAAGITPACAGKSPPDCIIPFFPRDHPRVCGEKILRRRLRRTDRGSPPRVRGKASGHPRLPHLDRITPACAGKRLNLHRNFLYFFRAMGQISFNFSKTAFTK